jgi:flagellar hook assembly protein FlgD
VAGPITVVELAPPRPNPFTLSTTFAISLPADADVDLTVHDLAGRRVTTLAHGRLGAGRREFTWDGAGARDGVYFVRLTVDGRVLSTRVALLKGGR